MVAARARRGSAAYGGDLVGAAEALAVGVDEALLADARVDAVEGGIGAVPVLAELVAGGDAGAVEVGHGALLADAAAVLGVEPGQGAKLGLAGGVGAGNTRSVHIGDGPVLAQARVDSVEFGEWAELFHAYFVIALYTSAINIGGVSSHAFATLTSIKLCEFSVQFLAMLVRRFWHRHFFKRHFAVAV
jgi:hypothetical protein